MIFEIRLAMKNEAAEIVKLLDEVTLKLHEKGIQQWEYPWSTSTLEIDIKQEYIYVVERGKEIIATFSIKKISVKQWFKNEEEEKVYLYRIAVLPAFQKNNVGAYIISYVKEISKKINETVYLDCWAGNKKLKSFYLKVGFTYCGDFKEEDYMVSVFKYEDSCR